MLYNTSRNSPMWTVWMLRC